MQSLWRKNTQIANLNKASKSLEEFVFPSGRQAIMQSLLNKELSRVDRIGVSEYSSQCIINAIGRYSMPLPIKDAIKYNIELDGVIVYEHWGWSFTSTVIEDILNKFDNVIFDCVDSPNAHIRYKNIPTDIIVSLSKCLGLRGGAFLSNQNIFKKYKCEIDNCLGLDPFNADAIYLINSYIGTRSHIGDLSKVDIFSELEKEAQVRNKNLKLFHNSSLSNEWSDWMFEVVANDCSAGIVPLFRGRGIDQLQEIQKKVKEGLQIESEIYNFNWGGSPLKLNYQPCIAFPVHGDIDKMEKHIEFLERI